MKRTIREKVIEQIAFQNKIVSQAGVNLVTCGDCGSVMFHEVKQIEDVVDLECPYCSHVSDPCDFPDFLYSGMENSKEFDEPVKSPLASQVLQLMDEDYSYQGALAKVMEDNKHINQESLEKELNLYI